MRTLIILRGAPASGKSSWIKDRCLQNYTLSSDDLRLLFQSPTTSLEGHLTISSKNDNQVWRFLYQLLEDKMRRGEFVIVDATHYTNKSMSKYKELINKYRYRAYYVDFSEGLSLEEHLERNRKREYLKQVPDEVIIKMYNQLQNQESPSSTFKKLTQEEAGYITSLYNNEYNNLKIDLTNQYDNIVIFGDIHGCYNPIKDYFTKYPYNEKTCYYCIGDLLDRGLQNKEVLEWACNMLTYKNFFIIEGNHEKWLRHYVNNEDKFSNEFEEKTLPQIKDINIKKVKELTNRLLQMAWFTFGNKDYLLTHGGIPCLPNIRMATSEMINGVGQYGDVENIYKTWDKNNNNTVQLHGHRNLTMLPAKISDYMYNLNDEIEWGGYLRVATIHKDDNIDIELFKNDLYTLRARKASTERVFNSDNVFIQRLNNSNLVNKKCLKDGVVSFNFTRDAFDDSKWNELTVKARGLFIDSQTDDIVARGFVKFFQVNEVKETTIPELKKNLQFPVKAYFKENGFLGLISWHKRENKPFIASKSTNEGDFADLVREYFYKLPLIKQSILLEFIRKNDCTLVFEVVDPERDPHIIKYNSPEFVLLAGIKNKLEDEYIPYEELVKLVNDCNYADDEGILSVKRFDRQFDNWEEFYSFFTSVEKDFTIEHEGWVFEDVNNFMLKFKTPFYKFWKQMRSVKDRIMNEKEVKYTGNPIADDVINYMINILGVEGVRNCMSIIDIREAWLKYKALPNITKKIICHLDI